MSRNLSATGWSVGGTALAALVGSAAAGSRDGVAAAAAGGDVVAGAVTISDGLLVAASGTETEAVASGLKSLMVTGGRLAGSGRGIAAWIASSAALLRAGLACASAEVADTVRKVAATAIRTRSNPARLVEQSRIVAPLGETAPSWNSSGIVRHSFRPHATIHMQTIHAPPACSQRHAGNSRQTDFKRLRFQRITRFCHAPAALSVTGKPRFKCSGIAHISASSSASFQTPERHNPALSQFASSASPAAGSLAAASSSLR